MSQAPGGAALDRTLREVSETLERAGVPSPRVDAEALLAHALGVPLAEVWRRSVLGQALPEETRGDLEELVRRRAARVPLQHLTGVAHFRGLSLRIGQGVFVPRPETEVLVGLALDAVRAAEAAGAATPVVLDLCTGSGAIALAIKDEHPGADVAGVEVSEDAHAWACRNVEHTGLDVTVLLGDAAASERVVGAWLAGRAPDVLTCNPPYIPTGAVPRDLEVRDHDPALALYGGSTDGLAIPLTMAARAAALLRPGGVLLMEHADVQGEDLVRRLDGTGAWSEVIDHLDLSGRPRVVRAVRAAGS